MPLRKRTRRLFEVLTSLPDWLTYGVPVVSTVAATWVLLGIQRFIAYYDHLKHGPNVVALYFISIALCTIIGGLRSGLLAVLLSLFSTAYFLIRPNGIVIEPTMFNYMTLAILVLVGSLVALGMEAYRNNTSLLVQNLNLLASEQARADQEAVLNKIGQAVRSARNPDQVLSVALSSIGQTLKADRCYFVTYNPSRDIGTVDQYWRRDDYKEPKSSFRLSDLGFHAETLHLHGQTMVVEDIRVHPLFRNSTAILDERGIRSAIIVPVTASGQLDSTLVVAMSGDSRLWENHEVALVETAASQTRSAVDAARLQQKEHNIAIQLQAALQPELSVDVPGLSIASFYRAALEEANVGGDFYDAFEVTGNRTVFVVGDVSGKGLAAASQVAAIRHMLRCLLQTMPRVDEAISQLNRVLIEQHLLPSFATLFVGVFHPVEMVLEYVSCGHEPVLLYRPGSDAKVHHLEATGPVIGVFGGLFGEASPGLFTSSRCHLHPGDAFLLYTDGVCDAGRDSSHLLGVDGIVKQMCSYFELVDSDADVGGANLAAGLLQYSVNATEQFANGFLRDDICLLAVAVSRGYRTDIQNQNKDHKAKVGASANNVVSAGQNLQIERSAVADVELLRRTMLADVLKLATRGKLRIVMGVEDLPAALVNRADPIQLDIGENVRRLRRAVREACREAELADDLSDSLEMAAGEAANNSLVHASNGVGLVSWDVAGNVQVRISDNGTGIPYDELPRATLERGYTTAGTLGQGFWIILQSVTTCWIYTSDSGTVVVLEQDAESQLLTPLPVSVLI